MRLKQKFRGFGGIVDLRGGLRGGHFEKWPRRPPYRLLQQIFESTGHHFGLKKKRSIIIFMYLNRFCHGGD